MVRAANKELATVSFRQEFPRFSVWLVSCLRPLLGLQFKMLFNRAAYSGILLVSQLMAEGGRAVTQVRWCVGPAGAALLDRVWAGVKRRRTLPGCLDSCEVSAELGLHFKQASWGH